MPFSASLSSIKAFPDLSSKRSVPKVSSVQGTPSLVDGKSVAQFLSISTLFPPDAASERNAKRQTLSRSALESSQLPIMALMASSDAGGVSWAAAPTVHQGRAIAATIAPRVKAKLTDLAT